MTDPNNPTPGGEHPPTYEPPAAPPPAPYEPPPAYEPPASPPPPTYQVPPTPAAPEAPAMPAPTPAAPSAVSQAWDEAQENIMNFDPKSVDVKDWTIIGLGVLAFLLSFGGFYSYSFNAAGGAFKTSGTVNAWHGFFGWFAVLAALAGAVILALELIAKVTLPFNVRFVVLILLGLAAVCLLLALLIVPGDTAGAGAFGVKIDKGHGWAYWITLLTSLGAAALAYVRWQASGAKTNLT